MYPSVRSKANDRLYCGDIFYSMEGAGAHEVIVETPDHDVSLVEIKEGQIVKVLKTCKERHAHLASDGHHKFILILKNHGPEAGASCIIRNPRSLPSPSFLN
jgi:UDPglucose--hexose-1-phosphate uridylyltransferase